MYRIRQQDLPYQGRRDPRLHVHRRWVARTARRPPEPAVHSREPL